MERMDEGKNQGGGSARRRYSSSALWFKHRRDALGLKQEELASQADVSQSLVSQLEAGIHPPTLVRFDRLSRILNALRATLADMLEHTDLEREAWPNLGSFGGPGFNTRRVPVFEGNEDGDFPLDTQVGEVDIPAKWSGEYLAYRVRAENLVDLARPLGALVIIRQGGRYLLGDKVAAWVPGRGIVVTKLCVESDEQMAAYDAKEYGAMIAPGAVLMGKVRELREHIADPSW